MRDYSRISPHFWIGQTGRLLRQESADVRIVALYLLSAPNSTMIGLYYLPLVTIAHETGCSAEEVLKALDILENLGFAEYDHEAEIVFVREMAAHQIGAELRPNDNRRIGIRNQYAAIPETHLLAAFFDRYADAYGLTEKRGENVEKPKPLRSPFEAPSKPLRSQEQEQEQEQDLKNTCQVSKKTETVTPVPPKKKTKKEELEDTITRVLQRWLEISGMPGAAITGKASAKRRAKVRDRLKEGSTEQDLLEALEGFLLDEWLQGTAPGSRPGGYPDAVTIFRDAPQVDRLKRLVHANLAVPRGLNQACLAYEEANPETQDLVPLPWEAENEQF